MNTYLVYSDSDPVLFDGFYLEAESLKDASLEAQKMLDETEFNDAVVEEVNNAKR